ncbi:unnamed protein product [Rotaria magnacalcarata]|nr:unnamed protein product [Rotaria magnacalcarata]
MFNIDIMSNNVSCWVLTSDKKGTIHQASGVPIRLGIEPKYKTIKLSRFAKFLGHINIRLLGFFKEIKNLNNVPNLIVSSGHDGLLAAAYLKAKNPSLITVHIQNSGSLVKYFNLVAVPKHDNAKFSKKYQDRVIVTQLGLHHLTEQKLIEEGDKFAKEFGITKEKIFFSIGTKSSRFIKDLEQPEEELSEQPNKPTVFFSIGGKAAGYD